MPLAARDDRRIDSDRSVRHKLSIALRIGLLAGIVFAVFMSSERPTQRVLSVNVWSREQTGLTNTGTVIEPVILEYSAAHRLSINQQYVASAELEKVLRAVYQDRSDMSIIVSADGSLRYGDVVRLLDAAKGAGIERIVILTWTARSEGP